MKANRFQCVFKVYPSHKQFKLRGRKVYFSRYRRLLLMKKSYSFPLFTYSVKRTIVSAWPNEMCKQFFNAILNVFRMYLVKVYGFFNQSFVCKCVLLDASC